MKTCILVPAHNEAQTIGPLVKSLRNRGLSVIVIDDGSVDNSGEIAAQAGAYVLRNDPRRGKGGSLQRGFDYFLSQDFDNLIIMDGDGQHSVEDIDQFLSKAKEHPTAIVTGTRMQNPEGMPWLRLWTNRFMSALISAACRQSVPDTQCGFRLMSREALRDIKITSTGFEIETEILIKASKKGYKIFSVPIKTIYGNEVSKINPFKDTIRFVIYIVKEMFS